MEGVSGEKYWQRSVETREVRGGVGVMWLRWDSGFATYKHVFLLVIKSDKKGLFFKEKL